jgi:hypothetical protein
VEMYRHVFYSSALADEFQVSELNSEKETSLLTGQESGSLHNRSGRSGDAKFPPTIKNDVPWL